MIRVNSGNDCARIAAGRLRDCGANLVSLWLQTHPCGRPHGGSYSTTRAPCGYSSPLAPYGWAAVTWRCAPRSRGLWPPVAGVATHPGAAALPAARACVWVGCGCCMHAWRGAGPTPCASPLPLLHPARLGPHTPSGCPLCKRRCRAAAPPPCAGWSAYALRWSRAAAATTARLSSAAPWQEGVTLAPPLFYRPSRWPRPPAPASTRW